VSEASSRTFIPSTEESPLTPAHSKLYEATTSDEDHVKLSVYSPPDLQRPTFEEATSHEFKPTHIGASFGPSWSTHWFRIRLTVPRDMLDKERLEFHWDANNEGLVWMEDGRPVQGRIEWVIPDAWRDGKEHTFYIEMACNAMFGNAPGGDSIQPPAPDKYYTLHTARITAVNVEARALFYDFWIIGGAYMAAIDVFISGSLLQTRRGNSPVTLGRLMKRIWLPMPSWTLS
jgi:alpha-mannosidase